MDESVVARLRVVRAAILEAAERADRDPNGIRIVAVTKGVPVERIRQCLAAGLHILGENRVQEALPKIEALRADQPEWHLIGHLQTNKARQAASHFAMIQSIDSVRLSEALAARVTMPLEVLIEVNVGAEPQKTGALQSDLDAIAGAVVSSGRLALMGLMTIAPLEGGTDAARHAFRRLREIRDDLRHRRGSELPELSMGMSDDYPVAVEEGATMLRLGRALFAQSPDRGAADLGPGARLK